MKRLEDISSLGDRMLEQIASDSSVQPPEELDMKVDAALLAAGLASRPRVQRTRTFAAVAGAVALAALAAVAVPAPSQKPADTFSDPLEAYAHVEEAFSYMSGKIKGGFEKADEQIRSTQESAQKIINVFEK